MIPKDEPFFFGDSPRLFGVWQAAMEPPKAALLYIHPFGEEKKSSHRAFVETARALSERGVASLRFDLRGCGDSEWEFSDARFDKWLEDIETAWKELSRRAPEIPRVLLGLRLGASLGALACARLGEVSSVIMWQPLIHGEAEFNMELRRLLVQEMMTKGKASTRRENIAETIARGNVAMDGYVLSPGLYKDICSFDLEKVAGALPARVGMVEFGRPHRGLRALAEKMRLPTVTISLPPLWARLDYIADAETGRRLADEGVRRWIADE